MIESARVVSEQSSFHGSWGFGVALRGMKSLPAYDAGMMLFGTDRKFSEDSYDEVIEVDAATLHEPGSPVLEALVGRFVRATSDTPDELHRLDLFAVAPTAEPAGWT